VEEISRGKFVSFQQLYIPQDNSNTVIMRFPRRR
jgi:hypothetical protein